MPRNLESFPTEEQNNEVVPTEQSPQKSDRPTNESAEDKAQKLRELEVAEREKAEKEILEEKAKIEKLWIADPNETDQQKQERMANREVAMAQGRAARRKIMDLNQEKLRRETNKSIEASRKRVKEDMDDAEERKMRRERHEMEMEEKRQKLNKNPFNPF